MLSDGLFWLQLVVVIASVGVAWVLQLLMWRVFQWLKQRLAEWPWMLQLVAMVESAVSPLFVLAFIVLAQATFESLGWAYDTLSAAIPLVGIWFLYRLPLFLIRANTAEAHAKTWDAWVLRPIGVFVGVMYLLGLWDAFLAFHFSTDESLSNVTVGSLVAGVAIVTAFALLSRGMFRFLDTGFLPQIGTEPGLAHAVANLVSYAVLVVGVIVGLVTTGVNWATLTVIAGGLSIGLGFGLQQIVSNFISGFILMFERSIGPGDVIEIGDTFGSVQNIGIRRMVIKTPHNKEVIIPNSHFLTDMMTNMTHADRVVRVDILVGVSYSSNPLEVEEALLSAAQHPLVLDDPEPKVQFRDFGSSSLDFALLVWTAEPMKIPLLSSDLRYRVWDALATRNIEIPFPQRDLHIRSGVPWLEQVAVAAQQPGNHQHG